MEYSFLLESNAGLLEEYFLTCGRQLVPSYTASNSPRRKLHGRIECITQVWVEKEHCGRQAIGGGCAIHWAGS